MTVSSNFVLYSDIVPLDKETFQGLRVSDHGDYSFAAAVNSVPITGFEFALAVRDYPIVFVSGSDNQYMPAIMLGVKTDENSFVDRKGRWHAGYIPLYVRQYPLMAAPGAEKDTATVCIDRAAVGEQGQPLFDDKGRETAWLADMSRISAEYLARMQSTMAFCARLAAHDLLVPLNPELKNNRSGRLTRIEGLFAVDEERLNNLADKDALYLFRTGDLSWIYLHLASLANFAVLANRKRRK